MKKILCVILAFFMVFTTIMPTVNAADQARSRKPRSIRPGDERANVSKYYFYDSLDKANTAKASHTQGAEPPTDGLVLSQVVYDNVYPANMLYQPPFKEYHDKLFLGWYYDENGTEKKVEFLKPLVVAGQKEFFVYPKYSTVIYANFMEGMSVLASAEADSNGQIAKTDSIPPQPERTDKKYEGWTMGKPYESVQAAEAENALFKFGETVLTENTNLYAIAKDIVKITYDLHEFPGTVGKELDKKKAGTAGVSAITYKGTWNDQTDTWENGESIEAVLKRDKDNYGYEFGGWYVEELDEEALKNEASEDGTKAIKKIPLVVGTDGKYHYKKDGGEGELFKPTESTIIHLDLVPLERNFRLIFMNEKRPSPNYRPAGNKDGAYFVYYGDDEVYKEKQYEYYTTIDVKKLTNGTMVGNTDLNTLLKGKVGSLLRVGKEISDKEFTYLNIDNLPKPVEFAEIIATQDKANKDDTENLLYGFEYNKDKTEIEAKKITKDNVLEFDYGQVNNDNTATLVVYLDRRVIDLGFFSIISPGPLRTAYHLPDSSTGIFNGDVNFFSDMEAFITEGATKFDGVSWKEEEYNKLMPYDPEYGGFPDLPHDWSVVKDYTDKVLNDKNHYEYEGDPDTPTMPDYYLGAPIMKEMVSKFPYFVSGLFGNKIYFKYSEKDLKKFNGFGAKNIEDNEGNTIELPAVDPNNVGQKSPSFVYGQDTFPRWISTLNAMNEEIFSNIRGFNKYANIHFFDTTKDMVTYNTNAKLNFKFRVPGRGGESLTEQIVPITLEKNRLNSTEKAIWDDDKDKYDTYFGLYKQINGDISERITIDKDEAEDPHNNKKLIKFSNGTPTFWIGTEFEYAKNQATKRYSVALVPIEVREDERDSLSNAKNKKLSDELGTNVGSEQFKKVWTNKEELKKFIDKHVISFEGKPAVFVTRDSGSTGFNQAEFKPLPGFTVIADRDKQTGSAAHLAVFGKINKEYEALNVILSKIATDNMEAVAKEETTDIRGGKQAPLWWIKPESLVKPDGSGFNYNLEDYPYRGEKFQDTLNNQDYLGREPYNFTPKFKETVMDMGYNVEPNAFDNGIREVIETTQTSDGSDNLNSLGYFYNLHDNDAYVEDNYTAPLYYVRNKYTLSFELGETPKDTTLQNQEFANIPYNALLVGSKPEDRPYYDGKPLEEYVKKFTDRLPQRDINGNITNKDNMIFNEKGDKYFAGFALDPAGASKFDPTKMHMPEHNVKVFAIWKPFVYKVYFHALESSVVGADNRSNIRYIQVVKPNEFAAPVGSQYAQLPTGMTRDNFLGWMEKGKSNVFDFLKPITRDVHLYPKWKSQKSRIVYIYDYDMKKEKLTNDEFNSIIEHIMNQGKKDADPTEGTEDNPFKKDDVFLLSPYQYTIERDLHVLSPLGFVESSNPKEVKQPSAPEGKKAHGKVFLGWTIYYRERNTDGTNIWNEIKGREELNKIYLYNSIFNLDLNNTTKATGVGDGIMFFVANWGESVGDTSITFHSNYQNGEPELEHKVDIKSGKLFALPSMTSKISDNNTGINDDTVLGWSKGGYFFKGWSTQKDGGNLYYKPGDKIYVDSLDEKTFNHLYAIWDEGIDITLNKKWKNVEPKAGLKVGLLRREIGGDNTGALNGFKPVLGPQGNENEFIKDVPTDATVLKWKMPKVSENGKKYIYVAVEFLAADEAKFISLTSWDQLNVKVDFDGGVNKTQEFKKFSNVDVMTSATKRIENEKDGNEALKFILINAKQEPQEPTKPPEVERPNVGDDKLKVTPPKDDDGNDAADRIKVTIEDGDTIELMKDGNNWYPIKEDGQPDKDNPITVNDNGQLEIPVDPEQIVSDKLITVTATDKGNNKEESTPVTLVPNVETSAKPSNIRQLPGNDNNVVVTGKGVPGSTITVYDENNNPIASTKVDDNGDWTAEVPKNKLSKGDPSVIKVTQTEPNKKPSPPPTDPTEVTTVDRKGPDAPSVTSPKEDDTTLKITPKPDTEKMIITLPNGDKVTVKKDNGKWYPVKEDGSLDRTKEMEPAADGSITLENVGPFKPNEDIYVKGYDEFNNPSEETHSRVTNKDESNEPIFDKPNVGDKTVTITPDPNAEKINVKVGQNEEVKYVKDEDGKWYPDNGNGEPDKSDPSKGISEENGKVIIPTPQIKEGDIVTVTETEKGKRPNSKSDTPKRIQTDKTTTDKVTSGDNTLKVTPPNGADFVEITLEDNSKITIAKDPDGNWYPTDPDGAPDKQQPAIPTDPSDPNNKNKLIIPVPEEKKTQIQTGKPIVIRATDKENLKDPSEPEIVVVGQPKTPNVTNTSQKEGTTDNVVVTGNGKPGATVIIRDPNTNEVIGTAIVKDDNTYEANIPRNKVPQDGNIKVSQQGKNEYESDKIDQNVDITPPPVPTGPNPKDGATEFVINTPSPDTNKIKVTMPDGTEVELVKDPNSGEFAPKDPNSRYKVTTGDNGELKVQIPEGSEPLKQNQTIVVNGYDEFNNPSEPGRITVGEKDPSFKPSNIVQKPRDNDGNVIIEADLPTGVTKEQAKDATITLQGNDGKEIPVKPEIVENPDGTTKLVYKVPKGNLKENERVTIKVEEPDKTPATSDPSVPMNVNPPAAPIISTPKDGDKSFNITPPKDADTKTITINVPGDSTPLVLTKNENGDYELPNGSKYKLEKNTDGSIKVTKPKDADPFKNGENITATATDNMNNTSDEGSSTVGNRPTSNKPTQGKTIYTDPKNPSEDTAKIVITATVDPNLITPGSVITLIQDKNPVLGEDNQPIKGIVDNNGKITFEVPAKNIEEKPVQVVITDNGVEKTSIESENPIDKTPPVVNTSSNVNGRVGEPIKEVTVTTDTPNAEVEVLGDLPDGLKLEGDPQNGYKITGTPKNDSKEPITLISTDKHGNKKLVKVPVSIIPIDKVNTPDVDPLKPGDTEIKVTPPTNADRVEITQPDGTKTVLKKDPDGNWYEYIFDGTGYNEKVPTPIKEEDGKLIVSTPKNDDGEPIPVKPNEKVIVQGFNDKDKLTPSDPKTEIVSASTYKTNKPKLFPVKENATEFKIAPPQGTDETKLADKLIVNITKGGNDTTFEIKKVGNNWYDQAGNEYTPDKEGAFMVKVPAGVTLDKDTTISAIAVNERLSAIRSDSTSVGVGLNQTEKPKAPTQEKSEKPNKVKLTGNDKDDKTLKPGDVITVYNDKGEIIGSTKVKDDGTYEVEVDKDKVPANGVVKVTNKNELRPESDPVDTPVDIVPPTPEITTDLTRETPEIVINPDNNSPSDVEKVVVKIPVEGKDPVEVTLTKDRDGNWTSSDPTNYPVTKDGNNIKVTLPNGEKLTPNEKVTVEAYDKFNNKGKDEKGVEISGNSVVPKQPVQDKKDNDGNTVVKSSLPLTPEEVKALDPNTTFTLTDENGKAITDNNGDPITATPDPNGNLEFKVPEGKLTHEQPVKVVAKEPGKNTSESPTTPVDLEGPNIAIDGPIYPDTKEISITPDDSERIVVKIPVEGEKDPVEVTLTNDGKGNWTSNDPDNYPVKKETDGKLKVKVPENTEISVNDKVTAKGYDEFDNDTSVEQKVEPRPESTEVKPPKQEKKKDGNIILTAVPSNEVNNYDPNAVFTLLDKDGNPIKDPATGKNIIGEKDDNGNIIYKVPEGLLNDRDLVSTRVEEPDKAPKTSQNTTIDKFTDPAPVDRVVSSDDKITINAPKDPNAEKISVTFVDALDPAKNKTVELTKTPDGKYTDGTTEYEVDQDGKIKVDVPKDITLTDISRIETKVTDELGNESEVSSRKVLAEMPIQTEDPIIPIEDKDLPENPSIDDIPEKDGYVVVEFRADSDQAILKGTKFYYVKVGTLITSNEAPKINPKKDYRVNYQDPWDKTLPYLVMENTVINAMLTQYNDWGNDAPVISEEDLPKDDDGNVIVPDDYVRVEFRADPNQATLVGTTVYYVTRGYEIDEYYAPFIYPNRGYKAENDPWNPSVRFGLVINEDTVIYARLIAEDPIIQYIEVPIEKEVIKYIYQTETELGKIQLHKSYVNGYVDKSFRPEKSITRGEVAAIFNRILTNNNAMFKSETKFSDVKYEMWYSGAINYLTERGIILGLPDGTFRPDAPITRGEFATLVARLKKISGTTNRFMDTLGHWANNSINAVSEAGYVTGYPNGTFQPNRNISRAEAVTIVNKMMNRYGDHEYIKNSHNYVRYTDVPEWHWAYDQIYEASITHIYQRQKDGKTEKWINIAEIDEMGDFRRAE